ncbi:MAG: class I SAM-dependent methyltransferase [Candidatus Limnocylindrales bacterium]
MDDPLATDRHEIRFDRPTEPRRSPIYRTVRRWLRPVRRVLEPLWWRLTLWIDDEPRRYLRADRAIAGFPREGASIRPLTRPEFDAMVEVLPYHRGRWGYTSVALHQAVDLIGRRGLRTALELGAPIRPVIVGADVMDNVARPELDPSVSITIQDARRFPWPYDDGTYDLFIALQVFEHLGDHQAEAFREVRRIARNAIISLPIEWEMSDPTDAHHRISEERVLSWFAPVVPTRVIEGNGGRRRRLVYVFEDLDPS